MTRWLALLTVLGLSVSTKVLGFGFKDITNSIQKEVVAVKDPIDKTAFLITFSQCKHVKKIIGVDYDQYSSEPDYSRLTLNFKTSEVNIQYNLTLLSTVADSTWFKPDQGLVIYIHGFTQDPTHKSIKDVTDAFLSRGIGNVVALDASSLIRWFYLRSSTMVRFIGEQLGHAISRMMNAGLDPASIHIVGHSLGSHIAGFTGKTVLSLTGKRVGRISGLDPAGPCFADVDAALKLNINDASFVDVIHTDAAVYGINEPVGHVDYWPNRGSEQPQCLLQMCSHQRSVDLFAESISNLEGFPASKCDDWKAFEENRCDNSTSSFMGYGSRPGTAGQYYLQTADAPPYALGARGASHVDHDGVVRTIRDRIRVW